MKRIKLWSLAVALGIFWVPPLSPAGADDRPLSRQYGKGFPFQTSDLPPGQLRADLESLPAAARARALANLHRFSFPQQDIDHLRVDRRGGVLYVDPEAEAGGPEEDFGGIGEAAPLLSFDPGKAFLLHSRPGSPHVVYLNFLGGSLSGTAWSAVPLNALPFSTDGNYSEFTEAERRIIADIWHRVAEDLAPFDIDVTTQKPSDFGQAFGPSVGHVMITRNADAAGQPMPYSTAGGVAYVGVWGSGNYAYYQPALVYYNQLGTSSAHAISEASSHEFGHNLSLSHDGTSTTGYYQGHGSGNVSWGPIMGVGYSTQVTQWSKGEYPDANNPQDDVAIIAGQLAFAADDHGGTMATAATLSVDPDGTVWSSHPEDDPDNLYPENKGVIERASDVDLFAFDHAGGALNLEVTPAWVAFPASKRGTNLDVEAVLYDAQGTAIGFSDPLTETNAAIAVPAAGAGRYYLAVSGVGNTVTPYSDYGSLGQYFIQGNVTTSPLVANFTYAASGLAVSFTDTATDSDGTIVAWSWSFGDGASSSARNPSHTYASGGLYTVWLTVSDTRGRSAGTSRIVAVTAPNVPPVAGFQFVVSGQTVSFTDTSSDSDGTISSWSWRFGDGATATTASPSHIYAAGGSYAVTLTVTDDRGEAGRLQQAVEVVGPPAAPSDLTASAVISGGKTKTKRVTLQWQDNSANETGFTIQRCTESGRGGSRTCSYSDLATVGAGTTTYVNSPVSGTVRYRVKAVNGSGSSAFSNEVRI